MRSYFNYIAIDLKSFYASVECCDRGLDPLTTNLVVADAARTEKTICLAVSPSLKAYGISGRARLFEVVQKVREVNAGRLCALRKTSQLKSGLSNTNQRRASQPETARPETVQLETAQPETAQPESGQNTAKAFSAESSPLENDCTGRDIQAYSSFCDSLFTGSSFYDVDVQNNPAIELDYLIAKPRMARYLEVSSQIQEVYFKYFAPEDIHIYSIDEVFIDVSKYSVAYHSDAITLASKVINDVLNTTGITATAGIGTNLYLAKVAMDILAKHEQPDENGVRMAALDEQTYKERLWGHTPITDFWRIGRGYARKLALYGMHTMGDIARASLGDRDDELNEATLFKLFGKNAELLIDHAWGVEPVSMEVIKAYRPTAKCKSSGQVLSRPYTAHEARTVVWEMADQLALDLMAKGIVTSKLTLTISYDSTSLDNPKVKAAYKGEITADHFGRAHPKHAHGTINIANYTSLSHELTRAALALYDDIIDASLLIRKVTITAERVISESAAKKQVITNQLSLFDVNRECKDEKETALDKAREQAREQKRVLQSVLLDVRGKFGKNAVIRAGSLKEEGTARQRNNQIGGHSA